MDCTAIKSFDLFVSPIFSHSSLKIKYERYWVEFKVSFGYKARTNNLNWFTFLVPSLYYWAIYLIKLFSMEEISQQFLNNGMSVRWENHQTVDRQNEQRTNKIKRHIALHVYMLKLKQGLLSWSDLIITRNWLDKLVTKSMLRCSVNTAIQE